METLFKQRKWYNIVSTLIQNYESGTDIEETDIQTSKLFAEIPKLHPTKLSLLLELYIENSKENSEQKIEKIKFFIDSFKSAIIPTEEHEDSILRLEIRKTIISQNAGNNEEKNVYKFLADQKIKGLEKRSEIKKRFNFLAMKFFENNGNFDEAKKYAKDLDLADKYLTYTLICNKFERFEGEIKNEKLLKIYNELFSGNFEFFLTETKILEDFDDFYKNKIIEKTKIVFVLRKCYLKREINILDLSKELKLNFIETLSLVYKCLALKVIEGYVEGEILRISGVNGFLDLKILKNSFVLWREKVRKTLKELEI